jgi:hypothetical protein
MDEIEVLGLHQWLCACRQLMYREPAMGAEIFAVALFHGHDTLLKPGWNRLVNEAPAAVRESYVFIGEEHGRTRSTLPPGVDPESVRTVPPPPPASESALWAQARQTAEIVISCELPEYPPARVEAVMSSVEREVLRGVREPDYERMKELARHHLERLGAARNGSRNGDVLIREFLAPARDVLAAYLAFELTGRMAGEVLAVVLSVQCNLPRLGPLGETSPQARAQAILHLAELAEALLAARERARVTPYFELTYLALLLEGAAEVLNAHQKEAAPNWTDQPSLDRRMLYVEELMAHQAHPAFALPAALPPLDMVRFVEDRAGALGKGPQAYARSLAVHPALRKSVLGAPDLGDIDADEALRRYRQAVATAEPIDALAMANEGPGPVAEENATDMAMHLLAYSMG